MKRRRQMKINKYVEDVPIKGYVEMYLLIEFTDGSVTVCKNTMDFEKEITNNVFDLFANASIQHYEELGLKAKSVAYISKELYEEIDKELSQEKVIVEWDENTTTVRKED
jgi:hypothetical protein